MNRKDAKTIAGTITNEQLSLMFENAKSSIKDWTLTSNINQILTKGTAWNILASNFDLTYSYHILAKINMIREFGEFLPKELKVNKTKGKTTVKPVHQDPKF